MPNIIYCVDGEDSQRLRAAEFAAHGAYIGAIMDRIQFGAPLSRHDTEAVAGDAGLVASLLAYDAPDIIQAGAMARDDPYFRCGAWAALEYYECLSLRLTPPGDGVATGHYVALLREDGDLAFDQAALDAVVARLGRASVMDSLLACRGFACNGPREAFALRALVIFRAADLDQAKAQFAHAWTVLAIPKVTGEWVGVSPGSVIAEQLARTR